MRDINKDENTGYARLDRGSGSRTVRIFPDEVLEKQWILKVMQQPLTRIATVVYMLDNLFFIVGGKIL